MDVNGVYKVQAGDTMEDIAAKSGISLDALKAANLDVSNNDLLYPGKTVNIPTEKGAVNGGNASSGLQDVGYNTPKVIVGGDVSGEQSKSPEESVSQGLTAPKPSKNAFFSRFKFF